MAKKQKEITPEEEFILLGWLILELKYAYYYPSSIHPSWQKTVIVPDKIYDKFEDRFKQLAIFLKKVPRACTFVGFPFDNPCGKLVASKLSSQKENNLAIIEVLS